MLLAQGIQPLRARLQQGLFGKLASHHQVEPRTFGTLFPVRQQLVVPLCHSQPHRPCLRTGPSAPRAQGLSPQFQLHLLGLLLLAGLNSLVETLTSPFELGVERSQATFTQLNPGAPGAPGMKFRYHAKTSLKD
jgi:hypothetical protein